MPTKPTVYIDSCCFIDAVKHEVKALPANRVDDTWHIKKLLEANQAGDIRAVTSTLSVAECVAIEPGQKNVPADVQEHFRRLLTSGQYVVLLQQTPKTLQFAQELRWKHNLVLSGADSLHIAACLEIGATEFLSLDEHLKKPKVAEAAKKLAAVGIQFSRGAETKILPDKYRQGDMLGGKSKSGS